MGGGEVLRNHSASGLLGGGEAQHGESRIRREQGPDKSGRPAGPSSDLILGQVGILVSSPSVQRAKQLFKSYTFASERSFRCAFLISQVHLRRPCRMCF